MADHRRSAVRTAVVWDALARSLQSYDHRPASAPSAGAAGSTTSGADEAAPAGSGPLQVVDLGGGTGGFAVRLAELGHRVTVVDPSPDALASLARRAADAGAGDRVRGIQGDSADLLEVVGADSADAVVCHGVLEVVDDPLEALRAMAAVLRPAGLLSLVVTQRYAAVLARALAGHFTDAHRLLLDPQGRLNDGEPLPRRFTEPDVTGLLAATGFEIERLHGARVFADLVPSGLVDTEPGAADALLVLESELADRPEFRAIAHQLHVLATRR